MTPGDICNSRGDICILALGYGPQGLLYPNRTAPMLFGYVWVTEKQALAAELHGWRRVGNADDLVVVSRSRWRWLLSFIFRIRTI